MDFIKVSKRDVIPDSQLKLDLDKMPIQKRYCRDKIPPVLKYQAFVERNGGELNLQNLIAAALKGLQIGDLHRQLLTIHANVLTTNFDLTLEKSVSDGPVRNHRTYENFRIGSPLLFQFQQIDNKAIWHIHGSLQVVGQMVLGISAYSAHLRRIHSYLYDFEAKFDDGLGSRSPYALSHRIDETEKPQLPRSWVDLFLGTDLHIIGLDLDFMEFHLWWLLSRKYTLAKVMRSKKYIPIVGKTIFYDITVHKDSYNEARYEALRSFGVQIVPIFVTSFYDGYNNALNRINRACHDI
jgi:hypothetical protein